MGSVSKTSYTLCIQSRLCVMKGLPAKTVGCTPVRHACDCLRSICRISWITTKFLPEALTRRSTQERFQNNIVIIRRCLPKALARGSPEERLQNKIVIIRKCLPEAVARGSRLGKAPDQDCYYQYMPSGGSGQCPPPPGKAPEQDCYY